MIEDCKKNCCSSKIGLTLLVANQFRGLTTCLRQADLRFRALSVYASGFASALTPYDAGHCPSMHEALPRHLQLMTYDFYNDF